MSPSIDTVVRIAKALNVSVDYLIGAILIELDNEMLERLKKIAELTSREREIVYNVIDSLLKEYHSLKTKD